MSNSWQRLHLLGAQGRSCDNAEMRQTAWLRACISRNRDTNYGREFHFDRIHSPRDFQKAVPIVAYDELAPWIMRTVDGEPNVLFAGLPQAFERTGGSSGGAKLIPYSAESFSDFRTAILLWLSDLIESQSLASGCAYWAISPATRQPEFTPSGIPIGLPDGAYLGNDALGAFAELSAVPPWVGAIPDVGTWQLVTLYWLLRREDLALVSVWSPTFFLMLLDAIPERYEELERALTHGCTLSGEMLPSDTAAAARLRAYGASGDTRTLWPGLKLVSCWADGSSRPFFELLRARLPHAFFEGKGLLATEGIVTVPDRLHRPVLAAGSGFFEFLGESEFPRLAHELVPGEQYEVVMTTSGGLYRYRLGDSVKCDGYVDGTPILQFVGRTGLVSDLVGEKLTEEFVSRCLGNIPGFRMLVPVVDPGPGYVLLVDAAFPITEEIRIAVETGLSQNPQYAYALRVGQLTPLAVHHVPRPLETYLGHLMRRGRRLGDVKVPALHPDTDWLGTFLGCQQ